jgi:hypothetical protein
LTFELRAYIPRTLRADGSIRARLGSFKKDSSGRTVVELYGDLKRHAMGDRLGEPVNEIAGDAVTPIPLDPRNRHFCPSRWWRIVAEWLSRARRRQVASSTWAASSCTSTAPVRARQP